ncbi:MAG TPA: polyhydroxyalkanoate synthesis regulator DNA-binding domain-containing protein [Longimicrobium sp.]|nr:polyhydroxyalkanoate synthesis regulator DNA-binding domain-containing protein [Longimicrobium sp.]
MARVIKRYGNRKLYDVRASAYVSLEDIAALIRTGETVEVLDNVTGEDITAQTLTQIVLEEGKRGKSILPTELLHDLLRRGGRVIDSRVGQIRHAADELVQGSLGRLTRVLQGPQTQELQQLRTQLSELETTLARILDQQENGRAGGDTAPAVQEEAGETGGTNVPAATPRNRRGRAK